MVRQALDPSIVGAKAVLSGLQVALPCEPRRVVIESDCKQVVSMLKLRKCDESYLGIVDREVLSLVELFEFVDFVRVFREANGAAHAMAHLDPRDYCTRVWVGECPGVVDDIIAKGGKGDAGPPQQATEEIENYIFASRAISLTQQLAYYKDYQGKVTKMVGSEKANGMFSGGIHILSAGSSDYIQSYYINPYIYRQYTPDQYGDLLMNSFTNFVQVSNLFYSSP
ncbi:hypothetical protein RDABS01_016435 [Bienertia sinuspersici]